MTEKNTFIAKKSDGSKEHFIKGKSIIVGLKPSYEAQYCTCTENTTNISEIPDWNNAIDER